MHDIFEDTSCNLELDRFKVKLREIWSRILEETYEEGGDASKEDYLQNNALRFNDEPQEETEVDNLMAMLEDLLNPKEELEDVKSEGKAPTYDGKQLKANNEKGTIEATSYQVKHSSTKTPGDSKSTVKSGTYDTPTSGRIATRKDARVIRSFAPVAESMIDELRALAERQRIGVKKFRDRI
tara:strand:+ start:1004 stop:1549 length:546 start_codon:yes stop_codon:yes gene_type:complete